MTTGRINQVSTFHEPTSNRSPQPAHAPVPAEAERCALVNVRRCSSTAEAAADFHQPTIGTSSTTSLTTGTRSWPLSTMPFRHSSLSHAQPFGGYLATRALAQFLGAPAEQASAWPPRCWRPKVPAPDLATDTSITPKSALRVSVQASHQSPTSCTNQRLTPYRINRKRCGSESRLPAVCGSPTSWRSTTLPWRRVSLINY